MPWLLFNYFCHWSVSNKLSSNKLTGHTKEEHSILNFCDIIIKWISISHLKNPSAASNNDNTNQPTLGWCSICSYLTIHCRFCNLSRTSSLFHRKNQNSNKVGGVKEIMLAFSQKMRVHSKWIKDNCKRAFKESVQGVGGCWWVTGGLKEESEDKNKKEMTIKNNIYV